MGGSGFHIWAILWNESRSFALLILLVSAALLANQDQTADLFPVGLGWPVLLTYILVFIIRESGWTLWALRYSRPISLNIVQQQLLGRLSRCSSC